MIVTSAGDTRFSQENNKVISTAHRFSHFLQNVIFLLDIMRPRPCVQSELMYWCLHCRVILYKISHIAETLPRTLRDRGLIYPLSSLKPYVYISQLFFDNYFNIKLFSTKTSTEPEAWHQSRSGGSVVYGSVLKLLTFFMLKC